MTKPMRIRATHKDGEVDIKALLAHEMETGQRRDDAGNLVPAWFIQRVDVTIEGKPVLAAQFGAAVSKDPYLHFKVKGDFKKGDVLAITWFDSKNESRTDSVQIQ